MKVLLSIEWFTPAYRAGGIVSSVKNQIDHLKSRFDFWVVTGNSDLVSQEPVSPIADEWIDRSGYHVCYFSSAPNWSDVVREVQPDVVYINGLFNGPFNRTLLQWCRHQSLEVRLASHGMLAPNALSIKPLKKRLWLGFQRMRNTFQGVEWHATSSQEQAQIQAWFPRARVHIAQNLPPHLVPNPSPPSGGMTFLSVGRVHPIKNYAFAAQCLSQLARETGQHITFKVVGPIEDESEVDKIQSHAHEGLTCELLGEQDPGRLPQEYQNAQALLVPSLTENFGQVIAEGLANGVPVMVSDQTPWVSFPTSPAMQCLSLDPETWVNSLRPLLSKEERITRTHLAQAYFSEHLMSEAIIESHIRMLQP